MNKTERAILRNLQWFQRSGVMDPPDGKWGVAERIVTVDGNDALGKMVEVFPYVTTGEGYMVLEHRRPDCNFQVALLFLLATDHFGNREFRSIAENILHYLCCKSGMRQSGGPDADTWNWHHALVRQEKWFDDNGWIGAIEIWIAQRYPELDARFALGESGRRLAAKLAAGLKRTMPLETPLAHGVWPDPEKYWLGEPRQPHWSIPACCAMLGAGLYDDVKDCFRHLEMHLPRQTLSEYCYALLGALIALHITGDEFYRELAEKYLAVLLPKADPGTGCLPSEHCEAPSGGELADFIYTSNWFFPAILLGGRILNRPDLRMLGEKIAAFLVEIQDDSGVFALDGAWRGMYDRQKRCWGGGDRYEGGGGSLYTGWTNAPISIALLFTVLER